MKYYIYALTDPITSVPFYVGKGSGTRWNSHLRETKETTDNINKFNTIQQIRSSGKEPQIQFWYYTDDEQHAYDVETEYIKQYGRKGKDVDGTLTNICIECIPPSRLGIKDKLSTRQKKSESRLKLLSVTPMPPKSEETKQKLSAALKGKPNLALKGKPSPHGKEELLRRARKGHAAQVRNLALLRNDPISFNKWLDEKKQWASQMRSRKVGKPVSKISRAKMSAAAIGKSKPTTQCPYCERIGGVPAMMRFHFDNCKLRTFT